MQATPLLGFSFPANYYGEYEDALNGWTLGTPNASVTAIRQTGATSIQTVVQWGIDPNSGTIYRDQPGSPYDPSADEGYSASYSEEVAQIQAAVAQGLSVMVRPTINFLSDDPNGLGNYYGNEYRADYVPTSGTVSRFFSSYKTMIDQEAQAAKDGGASLLCLGVELNPVLTSTTYQAQWNDIIASIRAIDPALKLTYSASDSLYDPGGAGANAYGFVDPSRSVCFWGQVDYAGVDVYLPLANAAASNPPTNDPTEAQLAAAWISAPAAGTTLYEETGGLSPMQYLQQTSTLAGKPLLFTEIGYQNWTGAAADPAGDQYPGGPADPSLQANLFQAFFDAWARDGHIVPVAGAYIWNWDPLESDDNSDAYSPENNAPALQAVTNGFASADHADVVFRNSKTGDFGYLDPYDGAYFGLGNSNTSFSIVGEGRFYASVVPDIFFRNPTTGDIGWSDPTTGLYHALGGSSASYAAAGIADFNGDGTSDILLRNTATGDLGYLATTSAGGRGSYVALGGSNTHYGVAGVGDLTGTGHADVLFRNASTGDTGYLDPTSGSYQSLGGSNTAYSVAGIGDFTGAGHVDILFRNASTGDMGWLDPTSDAYHGLGGSNASYSVAAVADDNGDGISDVLFRNPTTGDLGYLAVTAAGTAGSYIGLGSSNTHYAVV